MSTTMPFVYEGERTRDDVEKLALELGGAPTTAADVAKDESIAALGEFVAARFGKLDALVHSLAFARKEELAGKYFGTSRSGFGLALDQPRPQPLTALEQFRARHALRFRECCRRSRHVAASAVRAAT